MYVRTYVYTVLADLQLIYFTNFIYEVKIRFKEIYIDWNLHVKYCSIHWISYW